MLIGTGKADITAFFHNAAMLGYAMFHHIMKEVESPLHARTFTFEDGKQKVAFVNCELGFITPSLKRGVLDHLRKYHPEFGYTNSNLMLTAQHTHCAPGGYSYYVLYNTAVPGFINEVYEKIVHGIVESIVKAEGNKRKGSLRIGQSKFDEQINISFNRSLKAYNQNKDVEPLPFEKRHKAVDRNMTLIKMIDEHGNEIGSINWFAVHTTSLSNNFYRVSGDNKGYAAKYLEKHQRPVHKDYLGIFAQGNCGDVSPKWVYNPKHSFQRGKYEGQYTDDLKSAKFSGHQQFQKALEINDELGLQDQELGDRIDSALKYVNFSNIDIDPKFTDGEQDCITSPACMGISMLEGSHHDGPGMHPIIGWFARGLSHTYRFKEKYLTWNKEVKEAALRKHRAQGAKNIGLESVTHRVFMAKHAKRFIIPGFLDETIRNLKLFDVQGAYDDKPWTPQVLPLQIIRLGSLAICGVPFEITTVAGYRLQASLDHQLVGKDGIEHVILCPYTNAYSGYITTNEEYQVQMYEAGHCVFGQWSLNALDQELSGLANLMLKPKEERHLEDDVTPPDFTDEEIERRKHFMSLTAKRETKKKEKRERRQKRHAKRMNKRVLK